MDAVRSDDEIGIDNGSIRERHPGHVVILQKPDAAVAGVNHVAGQGAGEHLDEVGAVHPEWPLRVP